MDDDLTGSVELEAYFSALRDHFTINADAPVGAPLAEFVDVIELTPVAPSATTPPTTSWRPKMLTGIGAFIATTTGKLVLGTAVAAASVGGMHAAEIVDVPMLPDQAKAEVLLVDAEEEADSPEVEEVAAAPEEEAVEEEELVEAEESDEEEAEVDADDEVDDDDEEEPKNHGAVVSDFAKNTELEGCEKGQAISALAKSKEKKKKDADDSDDDDEAEAEELVEEKEEESSKCKSDDEKEKDSDSDKDEDDEDEDEDEDGDGPPEGKGHNRDDHPGKGKKADSDD